MNDLPELVLVELFAFFSLKEVRLFGAVNRHWRAVASKCTKKRLCVCHPTSPFIDCFENREILLIERKVDCAAIFSPTLKRGLAELWLFQSPISADLQNQLSDFSNLKILRINGLPQDIEQFPLTLPGLNTLSLKGFNQTVVLNCQSLQNLTIHNSRKQRIVIDRPKSIRFLECQFLNDNFQALANLEQLTTLKIEISLLQFDRLRKLEVYPAWQDFEQLIQVVQAEWPPGTNRPTILINGLVYPGDGQVDMRLFDSYRANYQGPEKFLFLGSIQNEIIATNYGRLVQNRVSVPFKTHINYSSLIDKFSGRIPNGLFCLFPNIQEIQVHRKVDTTSLLTFLRTAKTVHRLAIFESELDQDLFDGLPSIGSIGDLKISEKNKRIRFDFLGRLHRLSSFNLHYFELPWWSVCQAFETCKYFNQFYFEDLPKENILQIRKVSPDCFGFFTRDEKKVQTNLETIFNLLNQANKWNVC